MKTSATVLTISCLLAMLASPAFSRGEDFLLYTPKPAAGDQVPASPKQGVLVQRITVKPGDTLRNISRKHLGVPSWFPQVLLFNSIKNPDLIHPGEQLLVPVSAQKASATHKATGKTAGKAASRGGRHKTKRTAHRKHLRHRSVETSPATTQLQPVSPKAPLQQSSLDEQETFQSAKKAYVKGDYRKSLELFDSFLRRFPNSRLAADASLYRADCYLKMSKP